MSRIAPLSFAIAWLMATAVHAEPQDIPSKKAKERAEALKENPNAFQLLLLFHGPQDKPFYNLTLSVEPVDQLASDPFHPKVRIDEDQAKKIITHLAKDGFLEQATDPRVEKKALLTTPGYSLTVNGKDLAWRAELGWDLKMLKRLDELQAALDGKGALAMKTLIARLGGYRREWEKDK